MRRKVQGFAAVTTGYGLKILTDIYDYVGQFCDFTIKFVDNNRDLIEYVMLFLFAYGFFRIGWTARTSGRIGAVIAGTLNGLLVANMLMEWGIGQYFGIAVSLCLLIYLIWGQEKHVWIPTAFMAVFTAAYYLGEYEIVPALHTHSYMLSALSGIASVVAISAVDEY